MDKKDNKVNKVPLQQCIIEVTPGRSGKEGKAAEAKASAPVI